MSSRLCDDHPAQAAAKPVGTQRSLCDDWGSVNAQGHGVKYNRRFSLGTLPARGWHGWFSLLCVGVSNIVVLCYRRHVLFYDLGRQSNEP